MLKAARSEGDLRRKSELKGMKRRRKEWRETLDSSESAEEKAGLSRVSEHVILTHVFNFCLEFLF